MKKFYFIIFLTLIFFNFRNVYSGNIYNTKNQIIIPSELRHKIGSGHLEIHIQEKLKEASVLQLGSKDFSPSLRVVIYVKAKPTKHQLDALSKLDIEYETNCYTPPLENHPYGFFHAKLPVDKLVDVLSLPFVIRMDTAERECYPQNNNGYKAIHADNVWTQGWTGSGVKVAILDSGLDTDPVNSDLPFSFQKKDYSAYPTLDDNVENTVTGHGTHVVGSVLGRGVLSSGNTGNGGGAYKGMAPDASLVFLKIGNDATGSASSTAMEAAMDSAVNVYDADIISMSYGGWWTYHDGSESTAQKVDWCYSQGVPVFISAGNEAEDNRHYSGTVNANDSTGFIQVNVVGAGIDNTGIKFNLVWYDGLGTNRDLTLNYYNGSQLPLVDVYRGGTTESTRGTESQISYYNSYLPSGNGTYYLKVVNSSGTSQTFHIYEDWIGGGEVTFANPDPHYTISTPATADHAFAIGAWTTRYSWIAYNGSGPYHYSSNQTENDICTFSSRGPRIDGLVKPNIVAPGSAIISIRDRDVYTSPSALWIDNDGTTGVGDKDYYVMQGTSMACPLVAGAAALLLQKHPSLTPAEVYDLLQENAQTDGYTESCPNSDWGYGKLNIEEAFHFVLVETKIFLEGPYDASGDTMKTALNDAGCIPLSSPYSEDPCTVSSIPDHIVDWVLVQLRSSSNGSAVVSESAFLKNNGQIVQEDGTTPQIMFDVMEGHYFIVVDHRNHLTVMSKDSIQLNKDSSNIYDFTLGSDQYYGTGSAKQLEFGVWGMWTGDTDGSGSIGASDRNATWNNRTLIGYNSADCDLNGTVGASDRNITWNNRTILTQVP